jgi:hypothetical protein
MENCVDFTLNQYIIKMMGITDYEDDKHGRTTVGD